MTQDETEAAIWKALAQHRQHRNDAQAYGEITAVMNAFAVSYARTAAKTSSPRAVTYDMADGDRYFALTDALEEWASRQRAEAAREGGSEHRIAWADAAEAMRREAEAAFSAETGESR